MADWPMFGGGRRIYSATVSQQSGAINTKGLWSEVFSSVPESCMISGSLNTNADYNNLADLAIGASGSEQVIVNNLIHCGFSGHKNSPFQLPLIIPAGTRVAVRQQSTASSTWLGCSLYLQAVTFAREMPVCGTCDTIGAVTADSGGTSIDPGGTALTKGSWVELSAAAARDYNAIIIGAGNQSNYERVYAYWNVDIGIGDSPSDCIIIPDYVIRSHSTGDLINPDLSPVFYISIPKGKKISVRSSCNITDAADRLFDVILYLFA